MNDGPPFVDKTQFHRWRQAEHLFFFIKCVLADNHMSKTSLFRTDALGAAGTKCLGDIVLIRPPSFAALTVVAAVMATVLLSFILGGSYTKRTTVRGQLVADIGILKVFAPQSGIVLKKSVKEGQVLKKGDLLYIISSERQSGNVDPIQGEISRHVAQRRQSLRDELSQTERLQREQDRALRDKIKALKAEEANVVHQLASQRVRVELAQAAVDRAEHLLSKGFISSELTQQKQAELLDQQHRLQALKRDHIAVGRERQAEESTLLSLPLYQRNQRSQIERLLASTTQEWTESEGKRQIAITAPASGIATVPTAEIGQNVDAGKPLLSVLPEGAMLQANLYAPSRAIGFVRPGDQVLLRYQAYPYQKFGHARGNVAFVSRTAVATSELVEGANNYEAVYRVTVTLSKQTITAYGEAHTLQAGMLVDADILQERRKLYEWVLEPLFSVTGKL